MCESKKEFEAFTDLELVILRHEVKQSKDPNDSEFLKRLDKDLSNRHRRILSD